MTSADGPFLPDSVGRYPPKYLKHHPVMVCSDGQLLTAIEELEQGISVPPDVAVWRTDIPYALAVRLARATGATDDQIREGPES